MVVVVMDEFVDLQCEYVLDVLDVLIPFRSARLAVSGVL